MFINEGIKVCDKTLKQHPIIGNIYKRYIANGSLNFAIPSIHSFCETGIIHKTVY